MLPLRFGRLAIDPPILLAPMSGLTHTVFRRVVGGFGGVGLFATEMLSARALPGEPRHSPYLARTPSERPLSYQLLVAGPEELPAALDAVHALEPDAVDLNLGCPAPDARRRGGGCRLMEEPQTARGVVAEARRRTALPLSAKIRLGSRLDEERLRSFCEMLEGEGVDLISVHARLNGEPYGRRPRWEWIGKVKAWVKVPVVGNGGIFCVEDARRCVEASGCDGLMIGRGAAIRPWLPAELAAELGGKGWQGPTPEIPALYERFGALLEESFASERCLGRLKEWTHYVSRNYAFGHGLATSVQASRSLPVARERAAAFFASNPAPASAPAGAA
ncbi:MAG: tRNA-dihydrouridine synthase family protein [Deltaproteobacteria bacterium]|nr:tRNA-dihydrouridine synthase family protein [Deltaproteobacteria bacterium]